MNYNITIDQKNKLVKFVSVGKVDVKTADEVLKKVFDEISKLPKGEALVLNDLSNWDTRLLTPEVAKTLEEWNKKLIPLSKKWAVVVSSFMLQKSLEHEITLYPNHRRFATEQEAMKWLLED